MELTSPPPFAREHLSRYSHHPVPPPPRTAQGRQNGPLGSQVEEPNLVPEMGDWNPFSIPLLAPLESVFPPPLLWAFCLSASQETPLEMAYNCRGQLWSRGPSQELTPQGQITHGLKWSLAGWPEQEVTVPSALKQMSEECEV